MAGLRLEAYERAKYERDLLRQLLARVYLTLSSVEELLSLVMPRATDIDNPQAQHVSRNVLYPGIFGVVPTSSEFETDTARVQAHGHGDRMTASTSQSISQFDTHTSSECLQDRGDQSCNHSLANPSIFRDAPTTDDLTSLLEDPSDVFLSNLAWLHQQ